MIFTHPPQKWIVIEVGVCGRQSLPQTPMV